MVLLVVGGGIGTLETILGQLQNKAPVVAIEESGGACRHLYMLWSMREDEATDVATATTAHLPLLNAAANVNKWPTTAQVVSVNPCGFSDSSGLTAAHCLPPPCLVVL